MSEHTSSRSSYGQEASNVLKSDDFTNTVVIENAKVLLRQAISAFYPMLSPQMTTPSRQVASSIRFSSAQGIGFAFFGRVIAQTPGSNPTYVTYLGRLAKNDRPACS